MKTFALRGGDLVLSGSKYAMVEGIARAQQQIGLALREPINSDRFHLDWGSALPNWIGAPRRAGLTSQVKAEVVRVLRDYILVQNEQIRRRAAAGLRPNITAEEMVVEVRAIEVVANQDRLAVKIVIRTAGAREFTILTTPGRNE